MKTPFQLEHRLGHRILRWVLSVTLISGILLGTMQIILDARRVSDELDDHAAQTMALVKDAATQAVFSIDNELARQVVEGLFEQNGMRFASITHPNGEALATKTRALKEPYYRPATDLIFDAERSYHSPLIRSADPEIVFGDLELTYDTANVAASWLERACLTFISGIAQAVILGLALCLVYHLLLTRPLLRIIHSLTKVNPDHPDDKLLALPRTHERDELGLWVNATNNLLVAIAENQQKHREAEEKVTRLSRYDNLTGLPSRETLLGFLNSAIEDDRRNKQILSVFCCGIDDFRSANDQYGYQTGDKILRTVADRLSEQRDGSHLIAGRLGGDQFVVIEKHLRDDYQAAATAEWLLQVFSRPIRIDDRQVFITGTIGIALFPPDGSGADKLLQRAEQTMTLAKRTGGNQFQFYVASVDLQIRERKKLEQDLALALPGGQFHLVYQPQIHLESQRIIGAEALLRWNHPERGLVPPDEFIPLAELNGTIVEIGQWVLEQACWRAALWAANGNPIRIAVNLSAIQLRQDTIVEKVLETLKRHAIPPGRLELEVTETSFMENLDDAVAKLKRLRSAGITIAVDDFGTGYSSLTYLKRMPVQHLKIDKQFIRDLLVNEDDTRIANTIIDLGKSLNLSVIAEGVETAEQEFYLRQRGCELAQGYYFSKPLLPEDFEKFVVSFHRKIIAHNT
ncbi:putative bifunctional diguanylate cyclase/phosphodiesterase [Marinobacter changyiensis]|uniref:putative bifunctional diguanylate cyclase/phosphodiesterase n=1 Tax=Marinobacter changyiensis TaxID=2604091 RepID=UPI001264BBB0|nr:GGDEF domain-containing phosphodiesterase [Marinobacter changyiensis]